MDFDLDEVVIRRGTHCSKWDAPSVEEDVVCAGVADMDFRVAPPVRRALIEQAEHGVFGYTHMEDCDWQATIDWEAKYQHHPIQREWMLFSPGVIPTLHAAVRAVSQIGDAIVIETPVYPPFYSTVTGECRKLVESPLRQINGRWERDLHGLEEIFRQGVKVMLQCSPHNPVGRVWTREEQQALATLCVKYDVSMISDEIHADIILPGHVHTPIATLPGMEERTITGISSSKTFNLAGLQNSTAICPNEAWRKTMANALYSTGMGGPNVMSRVAQRVAYTQGRPWLEAVLGYVNDNAKLVVGALNECGLPTAMVEGTYLAWADATRLNKKGEELVSFLVEKAGVFVTGGDSFGAPGWFRLNLATTRANMEKAVQGFRKI